MHIAQFIHRYPPALGGAEAYSARLCEYLHARGDHVRVWTSSAIQLEELWRRPVETPDLPSLPGSPEVVRYRPLYLPARRYLLKALSLIPIRRWQCLTMPSNPVCPGMWHAAGRYDGPLDAVHAAAFPYSFPILCGLRLAHHRGVPFFLTPFLHLGVPDDPDDRTRRQYTRPHLRWLLQQANGVFVQTRLEARAVLELGVSEERVILQGLGVDSAECTGGDRQEMRSKLELAPEDVVVGHLANNSAEKGTCDLLLAAQKLWDRGRRFRIVLAGPEMPNFRAFWDSFSTRENVIRLGVLSEKGKRDFFAAIDVFALPSRTDSFGLVLLEAWANGKANLVYRAGGPAELVRDGIDGLHAECGNIAHLSRQLERLIEDANFRRQMGTTGQARIEREFQWDDKLAIVRNALAEKQSINHGIQERERKRAV